MPHTVANLLSATCARSLPKAGDGKGGAGFVKFCDEDVMSDKAHGTSAAPVQQKLRWDVERDTADRICNFNRHCAQPHARVQHAHPRPSPRAVHLSSPLGMRAQTLSMPDTGGQRNS